MLVQSRIRQAQKKKKLSIRLQADLMALKETFMSSIAGEDD